MKINLHQLVFKDLGLCCRILFILVRTKRHSSKILRIGSLFKIINQLMMKFKQKRIFGTIKLLILITK
jgi:hypothetical protein